MSKDFTCPPVLLLGFNRPNLLRKAALAALSAQPEAAYIVIDGPRPDRPKEEQLCQNAFDTVTNLAWPCPVYPILREKNLGCQNSVSDAITWFFSEVEYGVILEDDCVPDPSFFRYCEEMLLKYKDDPRVGCITGDNFQPTVNARSDSYYFSRYPHCWGWATWRRCWQWFDFQMTSQRSDMDTAREMGCTQREAAYWAGKFRGLRQGTINTWDYRWLWSLWNVGAATVTPRVNLVENIGFGDDATHTRYRKRVPKAQSLDFPLRHPKMFELNRRADAIVARKHYGISAFRPLRVAGSKALQIVRRR